MNPIEYGNLLHNISFPKRIGTLTPPKPLVFRYAQIGLNFQFKPPLLSTILGMKNTWGKLFCQYHPPFPRQCGEHLLLINGPSCMNPWARCMFRDHSISFSKSYLQWRAWPLARPVSLVGAYSLKYSTSSCANGVKTQMWSVGLKG